MKRETLLSCDASFFEGDLGEVIKKLAGIKKTWKKAGYTNVTISFEDEWGYYDDHSIVVKITGIKVIKNGRNLFK